MLLDTFEAVWHEQRAHDGIGEQCPSWMEAAGSWIRPNFESLLVGTRPEARLKYANRWRTDWRAVALTLQLGGGHLVVAGWIVRFDSSILGAGTVASAL